MGIYGRFKILMSRPVHCDYLIKVEIVTPVHLLHVKLYASDGEPFSFHNIDASVRQISFEKGLMYDSTMFIGHIIAIRWRC